MLDVHPGGGGGEEVGVSKLCGRDVHTETRNEGTSHPRKCLIYILERGGEEVGVSKLCGRDVQTETRNEGTSHPRKCLIYILERGGEEVGVSKLCGRDVHTETRNEGTSIETSYNKTNAWMCPHTAATTCPTHSAFESDWTLTIIHVILPVHIVVYNLRCIL